MDAERADGKFLDALEAACGGLGNIEAASCCATRLRLRFRDASLAGAEALGALEGCAGLVVRAGEHQLVLGFDAARLCRGLRARLGAAFPGSA